MDLGNVTVSAAVDLSDALTQVKTLGEAMQSLGDDAKGVSDATGDLASGLTAAGSAAGSAAPAFSNLDEQIQAFVNSGMAVKEALEAAAFGPYAADVQGYADALGIVVEAASGASTSLGEMGAAMGSAGSSAGGAAEQLSLFDEAISVPYADEAGQLNLFTTALEPIAGAATTAAEAMANAAAAAAEAGQAAENGAAGWSAYGDAAQAIVEAQRQADTELSAAKEALDQIEQAYSLGEASANDLARAEEALASATANANPALKETGEAAHEAEGGLSEMAEKLVAIGEALVVTEGFREFAQEALEASDNIARANIALTTITGSAEKAEDVIKGLEELGVSDGLAMPSLLTAATRMQQLLPAGSDVVGILGKIADGAAVMGTDITTAANAFDRMVSSGNVSARVLMQVGLNLSQLAAAMNEVNPAANATAESVAKMLKSMDGQDRIQVFETALDGLAGTAQKVAEQTFGGQWQILANQWEQIMVDVGQAILPVITSLTDLMKVDILPWVKDVVDAFRALPAPIQDIVVALAVAVPATAALAGGLGALGLAMNGLTTLGSAIGGLLETLGIGAGAAATAVEGLGAAEVVAEGGLAAFGIALGPIALALAALGTGAALAWSELQKGTESLRGLNDQFESFLISEADAAKTQQDFAKAQDDLNKALEAGALSADQAKVIQGYLTDAMATQGATVDTTATKWENLTKAQKAAASSDLKGIMDSLGGSIKILGQNMTLAQASAEASVVSMGHLKDAVSNAQQKLIDAVTAYDKLKAAGSDLTAATDSVTKAQDALTKAQNSLNSALQATAPVVTNVAHATKEFADDTLNAVTPAQNLANVLDAESLKVGALAKAWNDAQTLLNSVMQRFRDGNATLQDVNRALDAVQQSWKNYVAAMNQFDQTAGVAQIAQDAIKKSMQDAATAADKEKTALQGMGLMLTQMAPPMTAFNAAVADFSVKVSTAKTNIDGLIADVPALVQGLNAGKENAGTFAAQMELLSKDIQQLAKTDLPLAVQKQGEFIAALENSGAPVTVIQTELGTYESMIQKLAKTDLPDAIQAQETYIAELQKAGGAYSSILSAEAQLLQMQIDQAAQAMATGQAESGAADVYIEKLEAVRLKQEEVKLSTAGWGETWVKSIQAIDQGFDSIAKGLADNLVDWKNWHKVLSDLFGNVAKQILEVIIQGALAPLKKEMLDMLGSTLPSFQLGMQTTQGAVNDLNAAAKNLASQMQNASKTIGDMGQQVPGGAPGQTQGGTGLVGSLEKLTNVVTAIASVISAIADVYSAVILKAIDEKLFTVEDDLLKIFNETVNARNDAWSQYNHMYDRLGEVKNDLDKLVEFAASGQSSSGGGGGGSSDSTDLGIIAYDANLLVVGVQNMANTLLAQVTNSNLEVLGLQNINDNVYASLQMLYTLNKTCSDIISAITAHSEQVHSNTTLTADLMRTASATAHADASQILGGLDAVTQAEWDAAQKALEAAQQQWSEAHNASEQLAALRAEEDAYNQLAVLATRDGLSNMAAEYTADAQKVQNLIDMINAGLSQDAAAIASQGDGIQNSIDGQTSALISSYGTGTSLIVSAVESSAVTIASAVAEASSTSLMPATNTIIPGGTQLGRGTPRSGEGAPGNSSPGTATSTGTVGSGAGPNPTAGPAAGSTTPYQLSAEDIAAQKAAGTYSGGPSTGPGAASTDPYAAQRAIVAAQEAAAAQAAKANTSTNPQAAMEAALAAQAAGQQGQAYQDALAASQQAYDAAQTAQAAASSVAVAVGAPAATDLTFAATGTVPAAASTTAAPAGTELVALQSLVTIEQKSSTTLDTIASLLQGGSGASIATATPNAAAASAAGSATVAASGATSASQSAQTAVDAAASAAASAKTAQGAKAPSASGVPSNYFAGMTLSAASPLPESVAPQLPFSSMGTATGTLPATPYDLSTALMSRMTNLSSAPFATSGAGSDTPVIVQIDGREVARATINTLKTLSPKFQANSQ